MTSMISFGLYSFVLIVSLILTKNPITLGTMILILALISSCLFSILSSSWFAFALFIIYIGGLMVMFSYFIALTPNQRLSLSIPTTMSFISCFFAQIFLVPNFIFNFFNLKSFNNMLSNQTFFFQSTSSPTMCFLIIILFLALITVVKVTKTSYGPLRPFNYA